MTNLILGHCARVQPRHLEPFLASLRRTMFAGDVCLFVEDVVADTVAQLRAHGVLVCRAASSAPPAMATGASRFFKFLDYLAQHGGAYANVLLVDPADTIFQSDPFTLPRPADIVFTRIRRRIGNWPSGPRRRCNRLRRGHGAQHPRLLGCEPGDDDGLGVRHASLSGGDDHSDQQSRHGDRRRDRPGIHNYLVRMRPLADAWVDAAISSLSPSTASPAMRSRCRGRAF